MWKKDLPIFLRPCRTSQPSWRPAAGPGPAEAPLGSSPLRDIPAAAGGRGSSMLLAASRLDADELSISDKSSRPAETPPGPRGLVKRPSTGGEAAVGGSGRLWAAGVRRGSDDGGEEGPEAGEEERRRGQRV